MRLNQRGMGIIDFAIGSAIVLITAAIVLPQFIKVSNSTRVSQDNVACLSSAEFMLSSVITQKPTQIRKYAVATNVAGGRVLSLYPKQATYSIDWIFPDLAPSWAPVTHQGGRNIINSVFLQTGAIARATNFYHFGLTNSEDICTDFIPLGRAIDLLPKEITEKNQLQTMIRQRHTSLPGATYSIRVRKAVSAPEGTQILHECNRPFVPAPLSYGGIDVDKGPDMSLELPDMAQDRAGLHVSIKSQFTNKEGQVETCEVSRYLAPYVDSAITNPEPEVVLDFNPGRDQPNEFQSSGFPLKLPNKDGFSARNSCRVSRPAFRDNPEYIPKNQDRMESDWQEPLKKIKAQVQISYTNLSPGEPGTVLLCRDQSTQYNKNYCGLKNQETLDPKHQPWVPCEMATLCGVPVDGSKLLAGSTDVGQFSIELPFIMDSSTQVLDPKTKSLVAAPQAFIGCDLQMDIAAVDIAGNSYAISNSKRESYHKDLGAQRAHIFQMFYQPVDCWNCKIYKYRSLFSRLVRGALGVALYVANLYTGGAVGSIVSVVQLVTAPVAVPHPPLEQSIVSATPKVVPFVADPRIKKLEEAQASLVTLRQQHETARCSTSTCTVKRTGVDTDWMAPVRDAANMANPQGNPFYDSSVIYKDINVSDRNSAPASMILGVSLIKPSKPSESYVRPQVNQELISGLNHQEQIIADNISLLKNADSERKNLLAKVTAGPPATEAATIETNYNLKENWLAGCEYDGLSKSQCESFYDEVQNYQIEQAVYNKCLASKAPDCQEPSSPELGLPGVYDIVKKKVPVETPTWVQNIQISAKYLNTLADIYTLHMAYVNGDRKKVTKSLVMMAFANKVVKDRLDQYVFNGLLASVKGKFDAAQANLASPIANFFKEQLNISEAWSGVVNSGANGFAASLISNSLQGLLNGKLDVGQVIKDSVKAGAQAAVSAAVDKVMSEVVNTALIQAGVLQNAVPMSGFLNVGLINTFGGFGHGPGKLVKETVNCTNETQTWKTGRWFSRRKWAKKCERTPIRSPAWIDTAGVPACDYNAKLHYAFPYEHINFIAGYTLPGETFNAPVYFDKDQAVVCQAKFTCTGDAASKTSYFSAQAPKDNDPDAADYEIRSTNYCDAIMTRVKYKFSYSGGSLSYKEVAGDQPCRMNQSYEDVYDRSGNTPVLKTEGQQMPYPSAAKYAQLYQACDQYGPLNQNPIYKQSGGKILYALSSATANQITYQAAACPAGVPAKNCQMVNLGSWDDPNYIYNVTENITRDTSNFHLCQPVLQNNIPVSINFPTDINANLPKISNEFYVLEHRKPYNNKLPVCFDNQNKVNPYAIQTSEEPDLRTKATPDLVKARQELNLEKEMIAEAANLCGQINQSNVVADLANPNLSNLTTQQKKALAQFKHGFDSLSFPNFKIDFSKTDLLTNWAVSRGNYQLERTNFSAPITPYCTGYEDIEIGTVDDEYGNPIREIKARCHSCTYTTPANNGFDGGA